MEKNDHFSITKFKVTLENMISIIYQIFRRRVNAKKKWVCTPTHGLDSSVAFSYIMTMCETLQTRLSAWVTKDGYRLRKTGVKEKSQLLLKNLLQVSLLSRKMHGLRFVCTVPGASNTFQVPVTYLRSRQIPGSHHSHEGLKELVILPRSYNLYYS